MHGKEWGDNEILYNIAQPILADHDICLSRDEVIKLLHIVIAIVGIVLTIYPNRVFKIARGMSFFRHLRIKKNVFVLTCNSKVKTIDLLKDVVYRGSKTSQFKDFVEKYIDKLVDDSSKELEKD